MSIEVAVLEAREGRADEFLEVLVQKAVPMLREGGASDFTIYRSQVKPNGFVLVCEWPSREARVVKFGGSPLYPRFIALISAYLVGPPTIDDLDTVFTGH